MQVHRKWTVLPFFHALDLSVKHNYVTKKNPLGVAIVVAETPNRIATWTDCSN